MYLSLSNSLYWLNKEDVNDLGNFVAYSEGRKENPLKLWKILNVIRAALWRRVVFPVARNVKFSPTKNDD